MQKVTQVMIDNTLFANFDLRGMKLGFVYIVGIVGVHCLPLPTVLHSISVLR